MNKYGTVLLFDIEELMIQEDIDILGDLLKHQQINLLVIADWFDPQLFANYCKKTSLALQCLNMNSNNESNPQNKKSSSKKNSFLIPNNLLSLNSLLSKFDIELAYQSVSSSFEFNNKTVHFDSGSYLIRYPQGGYVFSAHATPDIKSGGNEFFNFHSNKYALLGLFYTGFSGFQENLFDKKRSLLGRIGIFGDSTCFESSSKGNCLDVVDLFVSFLRK